MKKTLKKEKINESEDKKRSVTKIIRENYAWVIAVLTFGGVVISNVLKFVEYLTSDVYFLYFGLDHNLYKYSDKNFIYSLCISIIVMLAFGSVFYCFKQIKDNFSNKKIFRLENLIDIILIFVLNIYIIISAPNELNLIFIIINTPILIIFEFLISLILFKKDEEYSLEKTKRDLINYIKIFPFMILFLIFLNISKNYINLNYINQYKIIDDNKVIVYSTNDYYLTLDCEIRNDTLTIYKGSQEKIGNNNVKSKLTKFNKVKIEE